MTDYPAHARLKEFEFTDVDLHVATRNRNYGTDKPHDYEFVHVKLCDLTKEFSKLQSRLAEAERVIESQNKELLENAKKNTQTSYFLAVLGSEIVKLYIKTGVGSNKAARKRKLLELSQRKQKMRRWLAKIQAYKKGKYVKYN